MPRAAIIAFVGSDAENVQAALVALDAAFVFIGSGDGEEAIGGDAIKPMFAALAPLLDGLDFSLSWDSVNVDVLGAVALLVAWGSATLISTTRNEQLRYRLTGVLVRSDDRWLWRLYHGSEPGSW